LVDASAEGGALGGQRVEKLFDPAPERLALGIERMLKLVDPARERLAFGVERILKLPAVGSERILFGREPVFQFADLGGMRAPFHLDDGKHVLYGGRRALRFCRRKAICGGWRGTGRAAFWLSTSHRRAWCVRVWHRRIRRDGPRRRFLPRGGKQAVRQLVAECGIPIRGVLSALAFQFVDENRPEQRRPLRNDSLGRAVAA